MSSTRYCIISIIGIIAIIFILILLYYLSIVLTMDSVNQTIVFYSKPFVKRIGTTKYMVTMRVEVLSQFTNYVYIVPFLTKQGSLNSPALKFQGFINNVFYPNTIGYVNVTGYNVTMKALFNQAFYNQQDVFTTPFMTVNVFAFVVPTGDIINVTFITNESYVPVVLIAEPSPFNLNGLYVPKEIVVPINDTPYSNTL